MSQRTPEIHLVPHFHFDPVWIMDQRTYAQSAFGLIEQYLAACGRDAGYHLLLSELDCLQPFMAAYSEHRQTLRGLVSSGRLSAAGAYGQPNEMSVQGESLVRNLLYGRLYQEGLLGAKPTVHMPLDVFGHCPQLPQIAAKAGFEAIVWSKDIAGAPPLCYAIAPNGTGLLQKHERDSYSPATFEEFLNTVVDGLEHQAKLGLSHDLRLLGGTMSAPASWLTGHSADLAARDPSVVLSTPDKYLAAVAAEARLRSAAIPATGRDFCWYHMGTTVTRAELKIANRLAENRILSAETWATLAAMLGANYPDLPLDKAWRQVLFGQHHGAVTGASSDVPFLDLLASYREALELAMEVEDQALSYIGRAVNTAAVQASSDDARALVVFNSLGWTRTDVCRARVELAGPLASGFSLVDEGGRQMPCQITAASEKEDLPWVEIAFIAAGVPSVGYRTYYLRPADALPERPAPEPSSTPVIENEHLTIRAEAGAGGLTSIVHKRPSRELLDPERGPANELIALGERPDRELPACEIYTTGDMVRASPGTAEVAVLEGPVFSQLRVAGGLADRCTFLQEVTLYRGLPRIDLRTTIDGYRGEHELLALAFPLAIRGTVPTFEDRFASVVHRRSCGRLDFRTFEQHNLSRCGLRAAQNWVDAGPAPSLRIVSRRRTVGSVPLGPCTIVASSSLREQVDARSLMKALLSQGVPCILLSDEDDPDAEGAASALCISLGRQNKYSQKLLEQFPEAASRLTRALGRGKWGGVLVRRPDPGGEWPDVPVLIADAPDKAEALRPAEALAAEVRAGGLRLPAACDHSGLAQPSDDCGVALINRGTLAASLESDGTLVAPLYHTAAWGTYPWGKGMLRSFFVPEHKSHVFEHSLYPHPGDWRRGGVVRVGREINTPLVAREVPVQDGRLPTAFSLVATDASNVIISAIKPLGNPVADHMTGEHSQPATGFVVRMYESEGSAASARLTFGSPPEEAWLTDLIERRVGDVRIERPRWRQPARVSMEVPACEVLTLAVRLSGLAEPGPPEELGSTAEPCGPIFCRYWDHNLGAAPIGNQSLTLWMRGLVPIGKNTRFSLGISNDSRDREAAGSVRVVGPEEWTMLPREVPYRIPAASQAVYEIMVVVPQDASPCFLRAVIERGDQVLQDVIPVGEIAPLVASLTRQDGRFVVSVGNPNLDYVEGQVALITPLESWGRAAGSLARAAVRPWVHPFRLEAGAADTFGFAIEGTDAGTWAIAKLMWYGRVQYVQEDQTE